MAHDLDPRQREMLAKFVQSRLDRRSFVKRAAGAAASPFAARAVAATAATAFTAFTPAAVNAAQARLQQTGDSAEAAVAAAQQFKGTTLNVVWEDGLQSQDPTIFSGPKWEELTGIKINTVSKPFTELFPSQVAEHIGATGAYDVLSFPPSWTADFVSNQMIEPLDTFIDKYMNKADLDDYHPLYRGLMNYGGKFWGLFDDGDTIILYYRTDLFEDQKNKDDFKAQYGYDLAAPADWTQYDDIQAFFTERGGGNTYGGASQRAGGQVFGWFSEEFRNRGGRFFNPDTMDATLDSQAGVDTLTRMVNSNKTMPPGVEAWGFVEVLTAWMSGQIAMIGGTWPPIGRWSEGTTAEQLNWVPETTVAGKVGYSVMPMGHSLHNAGFNLGVSADSKNKEAAYLFVQWLTSPTISLERVMLPYALRDPFRLSHYSSEEYRGRWANAGKYLDTLKAAADTALLDIIMPGSAEYHTALDDLVTSAQGGTPVADALKAGNDTFNAITDRIGRDPQKTAYADFVALKGSYYS
ncbi:MAG: multiple sugar transport system substrate-binding protein [Thermomicrobiales bacterium]|nr:multiple sugar transport system substrate-binding protein [Thermomicrobiales bacterium]